MRDFDGRFWLAGDPGFEAEATSGLFNARLPSRRPKAVLRASGVADIVAGVRLARRSGWQVAVRAGGHSWDAWSLRDGTLLIDVTELDDLSYDAASGIATVGAGLRGGLDIDPFLESHGRFFPVGHAPSVGISGFLLQGGLGWNTRGWGWAAELVDSLDVVTAAGEHVRCSERENADLFWMARGSGPGFTGVVTAFRLRTRPRFRELTHATHVYPIAAAGEVLDWFAARRHDVPDEVELAVVGCTLPGHGQVVLVDALSFDGCAGSLAELDASPLRHRALTADLTECVPFADLQAAQEKSNPEAHRYHVDNMFLIGPVEGWRDALAATFGTLPTPRTFTVLGDLGPTTRRPRPDMAFSLDTDLYFAAYVIAETADDDARCRTWLDNTMRTLAPASAGCYLGDSDLARRSDRVMSDAAWERYLSIRNARDPERLFPGFITEPSQAPARPVSTPGRRVPERT